MILCFIITCLLAFTVGFICGNAADDVVLSPKGRQSRAEVEKLKQEFRNFLDYDGSEQS